MAARRSVGGHFPPMLAKPIDEVPDSAEWLIEAKLDGWRAVAGRHADGAWLQSRTGEKLDTVPYINEAVVALVGEDTVLDGELISQGGEWNQVQTVLSRHRVHAPSPESPALLYVVFDVQIWEGEDLRGEPLRARRALLESHFGTHAKRADGLVLLNPATTSSPGAADAILATGVEGAMVKRLDSRYRNGVKAGEWGKFKPDETEDVVFTGTYEPTPGSKYDGVAVGGFTFKRANGYEGRCAGMTDVVREMFTEPAVVKAHLGRVMEVTFKRGATTEAMRHPQFKRFRDPKDKGSLGKDEDSGQTQRAPRRVPTASAPASTPGRMRNYSAMGEAKLLTCLDQLERGEGDAYDRCLNGGSGNPRADLAKVIEVAKSKGWL